MTCQEAGLAHDSHLQALLRTKGGMPPPQQPASQCAPKVDAVPGSGEAPSPALREDPASLKTMALLKEAESMGASEGALEEALGDSKAAILKLIVQLRAEKIVT